MAYVEDQSPAKAIMDLILADPENDETHPDLVTISDGDNEFRAWYMRCASCNARGKILANVYFHTATDYCASCGRQNALFGTRTPA